MLKKLIILPFIMLMMTACGNEDTEAVQTQDPEPKVDDVENDNGQTDESDTETKEPVKPNTNAASGSKAGKVNFQSIIPSEWGIKLPTDFPVNKGKYLTAIAGTKKNLATFKFYATDKPLDLNDPNIKNSGELVGQLVITNHPTVKSASEEIDQTVFSEGEAVDLGYGITGYQDAGAGSLFTSWNEGRWAIMARSTTVKSEESLKTAKETVKFLETHMLPIPKQYGQLHIDAKQKGSLAKWQKQKNVFTLTDFGDNTLKWLVTFE